MKSTTPIRIQLTLPEEEEQQQQQQTRRSSFDFNIITSMLSPSKPKITTSLCRQTSINSLDKQRTPRFSSLSSSYAQFLKKRDMDKSKKIVSRRYKKIKFHFFFLFSNRNIFFFVSF
jgi:hypothetical protein